MMFPSEACVEVRIWDPPMILLVPFRAGLFALLLLGPGLLMPLLLKLLLHLMVVLRFLRMPVTALRLLSSFALRRHLAAISALRLLIFPVVWPGLFLWPCLLLRLGLFLPILRPLIVLLIIPVLVLRDGRDRRSQ
jgi:hypothetical protein